MATATSPTGAYIAFGDTDGLIHMLSSTSHEIHVPFNGFDGQPALWADIPDPLPDIAWDLNTFVFPFYPLHTIIRAC
jgi:PAB-dependent poly(A)-specific ribonuclease subunit 2